MHCFCSTNNCQEYHGRHSWTLETRVGTRYPGGVSVSCLASRTLLLVKCYIVSMIHLYFRGKKDNTLSDIRNGSLKYTMDTYIVEHIFTP